MSELLEDYWKLTLTARFAPLPVRIWLVSTAALGDYVVLFVFIFSTCLIFIPITARFEILFFGIYLLLICFYGLFIDK